MELDRDTSTTDEYFMTAAEIFDYCGGEHTGTLRVDALMEKLAPFVKTNKAEVSYLQTLLDPDHTNPKIDVITLANALHQYSESQKTNLDESFNLKSGPLPQDSDSGISSDGFQLVEELQSEVREKAHLALQLRAQLDITDRHHEEALSSITAERDSLRAHLALLREENITLIHVRRDYEEACERLCQSETALGETRRELDAHRRRVRQLQEEVAQLENEKITLQELLAKSKAECHRMNEMYAARQSTLLEQNETLRTQHADLTAKLQDQEEYLQQLIKEKVILEMELKDMLNKSNQTRFQIDNSIEVSYTEDQMLTALDTLNMDTRFSPENRIMDDESFMTALREDQGRQTNISLFDEIRLSFSNYSRYNTTEKNDSQYHNCMETLDNSMTTVGTQTDDDSVTSSEKRCFNYLRSLDLVGEEKSSDTLFKNLPEFISVQSQTDGKVNSSLRQQMLNENNVCVETQTDIESCCMETQTDFESCCIETQTDLEGCCIETQTDFESCCIETQTDLEGCCIETQTDFESCCMETQTDFENPCMETQTEFKGISSGTQTNKVNSVCNDSQTDNTGVCFGTQTNSQEFSGSIETQTMITMLSYSSCDFGVQTEIYQHTKSIDTQTDIEQYTNNNNSNVECPKCLDCEKHNLNAAKLESDLEYSQSTISELQNDLDKYEKNLDILQSFLDDGNTMNKILQTVVSSLQTKLAILEAACDDQRERIELLTRETSCVDCQTEFDHTSVSTQAEVPCLECEERRVVTPQHKRVRRYLWEPLKCMFQTFAVICFVCAISVLYGVTRRWNSRCERDIASVPWRWFDAQDMMDLLLRIDYGVEVPM